MVALYWYLWVYNNKECVVATSQPKGKFLTRTKPHGIGPVCNVTVSICCIQLSTTVMTDDTTPTTPTTPTAVTTPKPTTTATTSSLSTTTSKQPFQFHGFLHKELAHFVGRRNMGVLLEMKLSRILRSPR